MLRALKYVICQHALLAVCLSCATAEAQGVRWVEDTYEDFADGRLDQAGQNIYVSRDGSVRTINRFDLNGDGHLDLLFNCTHDTYQMLPATVGTVSHDRKCASTELAVEGSLGAEVGDLNRDGYEDLVICPNGIGVHHDRRFLSIAWGGPGGWTNSRITSALPINAAARVAIVDLNADQWPDIAVLGGTRWMVAQPQGRIIRVVWGSNKGFTAVSRTDYGVEGAVDMAAADFDQDGAADLAVLRSDAHVKLLWGT
ncbi:MAG: FG-GAP-like repeat-containing protein, partial [Planctomycetaceae bacterium]